MRRQDKYPDTPYFHFYNANSHGKISGDCAIRAVCTALDQTWEQTAHEMSELGIKYGYTQNDQHTIEKYLKLKGYVKCAEPRRQDNTKMSVKEFIDSSCVRDAVAYVGSHHIVAIKDGRVYDIWDSSRQTIHTYFVREE